MVHDTLNGARAREAGPDACPACGAPRMDPQPRVRPEKPQEMHLWFACGAEQFATGKINAMSTWEWHHVGSTACVYVEQLRRNLGQVLMDGVQEGCTGTDIYGRPCMCSTARAQRVLDGQKEFA